MESKSIDGVVIKNIVRHKDERGYFAELMKEGEPGFHRVSQTSYAITNPGVIKAFHYHDYPETWVVIEGSAKIVMYDPRQGSPTKGVTQVVLGGEENPIVLSIPARVAHGYQALGDKPVGMLYHAGEAYDANNKAQIGTIPFDSPEIAFDWSTSV